eukprot:2548337-Prymnesium_polylepis.3
MAASGWNKSSAGSASCTSSEAVAGDICPWADPRSADSMIVVFLLTPVSNFSGYGRWPMMSPEIRKIH